MSLVNVPMRVFRPPGALVQNHAHMHNCCCCSSKKNLRTRNAAAAIAKIIPNYFWLAVTFLVIMVHSQLFLSPHFAHGSGASGYTDDSVLIPRQYILTVTDELLARWVNLESERPCGQDNERVSGTSVGSSPSTYRRVLLRKSATRTTRRSFCSTASHMVGLHLVAPPMIYSNVH